MARQTAIRNNTRFLLEQQGGLCYFCNTDKIYMQDDVDYQYYKLNKHLSATFDHIIPKSKGGTYKRSNGVCACHFCNVLRNTMRIDEFVNIHDAADTRKRLVIRTNQKSPKIITAGQANKKKFAAKNKRYLIVLYATMLEKSVNEVFEIYFDKIHVILKNESLQERKIMNQLPRESFDLGKSVIQTDELSESKIHYRDTVLVLSTHFANATFDRDMAGVLQPWNRAEIVATAARLSAEYNLQKTDVYTDLLKLTMITYYNLNSDRLRTTVAD